MSSSATTQRHWTHAGRDRTAVVHIPPSVKTSGEPVPLMIVLHGFLADGAMTQALTGFDAVADKHGFVVVYPDGLERMWRFWEGTDHAGVMRGLGLEVVDDPGYLLKIIDDLAKEKVIDPKRVYLSGMSNGAFMTNRMAWEHSDRFAAVAPVAGTIAQAMLPAAKAKKPVPVIYFHGTADKIVEYAGSDKYGPFSKFIGADALGEWWRKQDDCQESEVTAVPDKANDGTTVKRRRYPAGEGKAEVVLYEVDGGGHTWPGGSFQPEVLLGKTCRDINASELIWDFCSKCKR